MQLSSTLLACLGETANEYLARLFHVLIYDLLAVSEVKQNTKSVVCTVVCLCGQENDNMNAILVFFLRK